MTEAGNTLLLKMLEQLRDDFADEREARRLQDETARQSRAVQHQRIDEVIDRLGRLDVTIAVAGQVDAQVRTELDALKKALAAHQAEIGPTIDEWKRIRTLGLGIVGVIAAGGVSLGAVLAWGGDQLRQWVLNWLHLH